MKFPLILLFILFYHSVTAQNCNCLQELQFIENQAERNLPAYHDQVIMQKRQAPYQAYKKECNHIAAQLKDKTGCIYLAAKYISFFRDEHLSLNFKEHYFPFTTLDDTVAVRNFFSQEKTFSMPAIGNPDSNSIEGYWQSRDKAYTIQVIKHKTPLADYAGLVINGDPKFWTRGQLKLLLKQTGKGQYECIYIRPSRQPKVYQSLMANQQLTIGRINTFYKMKDTLQTYQDIHTFDLPGKLEFRELSATTNYLRIPSFDADLYLVIDSFVKSHLAVITSKPNLIIDIRNNGGGGGHSTDALLPLVLENKLNPDAFTFVQYATPDHIDYYRKTMYKNCINHEDSVGDDSTMAIMLRSKGGYTPVEFDSTKTDTSYTIPSKVGIIANRWCASATEGFISTAKTSSKVTLYGENTAGMISYGDWRMVDMPCLPVFFTICTLKTYFRNQEEIESTGIAPNVHLDPDHEENWIDEVRKLMEK